MPIVRSIKVWHTEALEIVWQRQGAGGGVEELIERRSAPPTATWDVRQGGQIENAPIERQSER
jgi:hypothetical protein